MFIMSVRQFINKFIITLHCKHPENNVVATKKYTSSSAFKCVYWSSRLICILITQGQSSFDNFKYSNWAYVSVVSSGHSQMIMVNHYSKCQILCVWIVNIRIVDPPVHNQLEFLICQHPDNNTMTTKNGKSIILILDVNIFISS